MCYAAAGCFVAFFGCFFGGGGTRLGRAVRLGCNWGVCQSIANEVVK